MSKKNRPYESHLAAGADLVTTYEATRAGFVSMAIEKNQRSTPHIAEARALNLAASRADSPEKLMEIEDIQAALLTASGISDKAGNHLTEKDNQRAKLELIEKFLKPAGSKFVEELVYRFLLFRGDSLGGTMRNITGALAQRKLTRSIIATLNNAGRRYIWNRVKSKEWQEKQDDDTGIENSLRGIAWNNKHGNRTLIYNLKVPVVGSNIDLSLFDLRHDLLTTDALNDPKKYIALGELKGGIDPAGADEHWKTAATALKRVRDAFSKRKSSPSTFFVGAAIEKRMAEEIWHHLTSGNLTNAANLTDEKHLASITSWICGL